MVKATQNLATFLKTYKPKGKQCNSFSKKLSYYERVDYDTEGLDVKLGFSIYQNGKLLYNIKCGTCMNEILKDIHQNCHKGQKFIFFINTIVLQGKFVGTV